MKQRRQARPHRFDIMFSDDESRMLAELALAQGLTAADVIRLGIRREHAHLSPLSAKAAAGER